jgi:hypothetical protein
VLLGHLGALGAPGGDPPDLYGGFGAGGRDRGGGGRGQRRGPGRHGQAGAGERRGDLLGRSVAVRRGDGERLVGVRQLRPAGLGLGGRPLGECRPAGEDVAVGKRGCAEGHEPVASGPQRPPHLLDPAGEVGQRRLRRPVGRAGGGEPLGGAGRGDLQRGDLGQRRRGLPVGGCAGQRGVQLGQAGLQLLELSGGAPGVPGRGGGPPVSVGGPALGRGEVPRRRGERGVGAPGAGAGAVQVGRPRRGLLAGPGGQCRPRWQQRPAGGRCAQCHERVAVGGELRLQLAGVGLHAAQLVPGGGVGLPGGAQPGAGVGERLLERVEVLQSRLDRGELGVGGQPGGGEVLGEGGGARVGGIADRGQLRCGVRGTGLGVAHGAGRAVAGGGHVGGPLLGGVQLGRVGRGRHRGDRLLADRTRCAGD